MWLWILTGFNIIITSHGYSSGIFPQSCVDMRPQHGSFQPSKDDPPFYISYEEGAETESFTVSLHANKSKSFRGFMLAARNEGDEAVGKFIAINGGETRLLNCNGPDSAVSHRNNVKKSLFRVHWEPPGTSLNGTITFRATFVESVRVFWVNVTLPLTTPSPTTPSTSTEASTTTVPQTTKAETGAPTAGSTTSIVPTTIPNNSTKCNKTVTVLMVIDSVLVVLKMELSNIIISTIINRPFSSRMDRMSKILCHVACEAVEVSSLVLSLSCKYLKDNVFPLLCVVLAINVLVVILTFLPLGPSHELKEIFDIMAKMFSVFHGAFIMACICVGCLEFVDRQNMTEFWTLWVLIAYTMGILLFVVWAVVVFTTLRSSTLRSTNTGCSRNKRKKKKMVITSISFISGAVVFAVILIPGILKLPGE
ncbi:uncharacterized protein LOC121512572 [Cheilinus undulatus]|uniref:uncharacterized protein LOC121512572 n=1 Tax=Cheilinus undulatus TaxID=241271 RepID=UPI001BD533C4|nr:uncharacterized protein LOC121512572 [Cheilinus undulatus]